MRLTVCLESDTEGQVLASVDIEDVLKQCKENLISKEAFEKMKSKAYHYGYRKGHSKALDEVLKLTKHIHYDMRDYLMYKSIRTEDIEKLKEQDMSNENNLNLTEVIREIHDGVAKEMYCKGIDDFVTNVKEHQYLLSDVINSKDYGMFTVGIEQIAKQLKEQVKNNEDNIQTNDYKRRF